MYRATLSTGAAIGAVSFAIAAGSVAITATAAGATSAAAAPALGTAQLQGRPPGKARLECIYMIKPLPTGGTTAATWARRGSRVAGSENDFGNGPSGGESFTLRIKGSVGYGTTGRPDDVIHFKVRLVGKGSTLREKGFTRVSRKRIVGITDGFMGNGNTYGAPGC